MTKHVMETVLFKLNDDVSESDFTVAAEQSNKFVEACVGFVSRRLSCTEAGQWIESIEWASIEDAKMAASLIGKSEYTQDFIRAIDGRSVTLLHSRVIVSL